MYRVFLFWEEDKEFDTPYDEYDRHNDMEGATGVVLEKKDDQLAKYTYGEDLARSR